MIVYIYSLDCRVLYRFYNILYIAFSCPQAIDKSAVFVVIYKAPLEGIFPPLLRHKLAGAFMVGRLSTCYSLNRFCKLDKRYFNMSSAPHCNTGQVSLSTRQEFVMSEDNKTNPLIVAGKALETFVAAVTFGTNIVNPQDYTLDAQQRDWFAIRYEQTTRDKNKK